MVVTVKKVKSCCGGSSTLISVDKPISRADLVLFKSAGFFLPENFISSGLFYAKKSGFVASASFGICKINVKCNGGDCEQIQNEFVELLRSIEKT